jgi:NADH-quinone oxidoreductase subunit I
MSLLSSVRLTSFWVKLTDRKGNAAMADGLGIIRGLGITFKHFIETYTDDLKWLGKKYFNPKGVAYRSSSKTKGIFTVQYPEEKLPVPEEFRFLPILVYELGPDGTKNYRCTSCGICAKVCPPQCIWIKRSVDPNTGKPIPTPEQFWVDADICMNCGFCAEYCPFDAIKMDHNYEIATSDRLANHLITKEGLGRSEAYYATIRPLNYARELSLKAEKEARAIKKPAGEIGV